MEKKGKIPGYTRSELEADKAINKAFPPEGRVDSFSAEVARRRKAKYKKNEKRFK